MLKKDAEETAIRFPGIFFMDIIGAFHKICTFYRLENASFSVSAE